MTCKYRIVVSLDGGGRFGLVPLRILSYIEEQLNDRCGVGHVSNWVDLYAATSTSTIIAAALSACNQKQHCTNPSDLLELYKNRGPHVFAPPKNEHAVQPLHYVLEHIFGDLKLQQLHKHFLFAAEIMETREVMLFTDIQQHIQSLAVQKIILACCAEPGYLSPVTIQSKLVKDARKILKNPTVMALNYARIFYPDDPIVVISIGTGYYTEEKDVQTIEAEQEIIQQKKLGNKIIYFRINPKLDYSDRSSEGLLNAVNAHLSEKSTLFDRLFQLMDIKAGGFL